jgi:hypothetical protein
LYLNVSDFYLPDIHKTNQKNFAASRIRGYNNRRIDAADKGVQINMETFTKTELEEARRAIDSTVDKCKKVQPKLKEGTSQHTLLIRRIKAFHIASVLIAQSLENQTQNGDYISEYKRLIQTTNLQKGYQEFVKFFRQLRTFLQNELPEYAFTGNIVENNMDYSYFQFTDEYLKSKGLKIVIAFVHADFDFQIWLSGMNRKIQSEQYEILKSKQHPFALTENPNKTDYILKMKLIDDCNYNDVEGQFIIMKDNTVGFIRDIKRL